MPAIHIMSSGAAIALVGPGGRMVVPLSTIATLTDLLIQLQDVTGHDPDLEPDADAEDDDPAELDGDETDHNHSEECFVTHRLWDGGPGCPIADADYGFDDVPHDECGEGI
jgi:hypothetical protein